MQNLLESTQKVFLNGSPGDPGHGYAYCQTCQGESDRVIHYISNYGWLGHATHVLELIPDNEVLEFGIDAPGFAGRRNRLVYCFCRARYAENVELFCREIFAPVINQALKTRKKLKDE